MVKGDLRGSLPLLGADSLGTAIARMTADERGYDTGRAASAGPAVILPPALSS
jgi:hypothetical protein